MDKRYDRSRYFEIPKFFYFEAGNATIGSLNSYNYRIEPRLVKEGDDGESTVNVKIWYGLDCFEKSVMVGEENFPLTDAGYREMIYWNDEQYDVYAAKLKSGEVKGRRTYVPKNSYFGQDD